MKWLIAVLLLGAGFCAAQTLPLGTVSNPTVITCATGYYAKSTCTTVTVSCPNVADIQATYGYHAQKGRMLGAVAFVNGSQDTTPGGLSYLKGYLLYGFADYQVAFATGWEATSETPNLMYAACRVATLLNYLQQLNPTYPFAVQAGSGGAGAVAYAMALYGLAPQVVELTSGPVFSDIELGCVIPKALPLMIVPTNGTPWTDILNYNQTNTKNNMQAWTDDPTCAGRSNTSDASNAAWKAMSIVSPGAQNFFPATVISGWVCNNAINNSAAQAYTWFSQITSPWTLTSMTNCSGTEDVDNATTPQGITGQAAITADIEFALHF
jgi:hypothetical protein